MVELNKVIAKQPANNPFDIGAAVPPVAQGMQADILNEIYKNRRIELFMSGLKLEDLRRFARPITETRWNYGLILC